MHLLGKCSHGRESALPAASRAVWPLFQARRYLCARIRVHTRPARIAVSPPVECASFSADGSATAAQPAHKPWRGKKPEPFENWTQRPGYGRSPEYLNRAPLPISTSMTSMRSGHSSISPGRGAERSVGGLSSRSGSASHLNRSRSATGLMLSNATVRLVEHPLAWRMHANGVNVRTPHSRQPAGANHVRRGTPHGLSPSPSSAALLPLPSKMATSGVTDDNVHPDDETRSAAPMPPATLSRSETPAPLCATFGLHPAFPRGRTPRQDAVLRQRSEEALYGAGWATKSWR